MSAATSACAVPAQGEAPRAISSLTKLAREVRCRRRRHRTRCDGAPGEGAAKVLERSRTGRLPSRNELVSMGARRCVARQRHDPKRSAVATVVLDQRGRLLAPPKVPGARRIDEKRRGKSSRLGARSARRWTLFSNAPRAATTPCADAGGSRCAGRSKPISGDAAKGAPDQSISVCICTGED